MLEIGFIGVGNMGGAILKGMLEEGKLQPHEIGVLDLKIEPLKQYQDLGCTLFPNVVELASSCKRLLLAVKPKDFSGLSKELKGKVPINTVIISIVAGLSDKGIQNAINQPVKVVLAMPNTPALVGYGATALAPTDSVSRAEFQQVMDLFPGFVAEIKSNQLNTIIPVNGSSPAFIYYLALLLAQKGEQEGLDFNTALELIAHTIIGSGKMLLESGKSPQELITMVSSPEGTTIEGLKALDAEGFPKAIRASFEACVKRAEELSEVSQGVTLEKVDKEAAL